MAVTFEDIVRKVYTLDADDLTAAAAVIAGMDEAATTEWLPVYDYTTAGGLVDTVDVRVHVTVTTPLWTGYTRAAAAERREWDRFCTALRAHEQGHVELVREYLTGIDARLIGLTAPRAKLVWEDTLSDLRAASHAYDRRTDHGRRFGTVITPP